VRITTVNWVYDGDLPDESALLARYETLTGWNEALHAAGADRVTVVQRFRRNAEVVHRGVVYRFCADGAGRRPTPWTALSPVSSAVVASRPDVAHVNSLELPLQTWRLRRRLPAACALVVQDHANRVPHGTAARGIAASLRHAARRRAMRAPDAYFFTSIEQAEPWRSAGLIDARQRVCAVNESSSAMRPLPAPEARRATGLTGEPAILWVGRLDENKDPLCVIDAFARVRARRPGATLAMIFGKDDLVRSVEKRLARDGELAAHAHLIGRVPHERMAAYYSAADVFVLGSHHESCGYAVIEACACGAAPAVTDIPAFRVLTRQGTVGRLWPAGDADACAEAILALASEERSACRSQVLAHFERHLSWPAVARQALAAYDRLIGDRRAPTTPANRT
jgi:glycosyltransferase involved in cell wall biosynthesis